jgi:hypothetical protein
MAEHNATSSELSPKEYPQSANEIDAAKVKAMIKKIFFS